MIQVQHTGGGAGATLVPLPTNITTQDLEQIINEAEVQTLVCSHEELPTLAGIIAACPSVRSFVAMDPLSGSDMNEDIKKVRVV